MGTANLAAERSWPQRRALRFCQGCTRHLAIAVIGTPTAPEGEIYIVSVSGPGFIGARHSKFVGGAIQSEHKRSGQTE